MLVDCKNCEAVVDAKELHSYDTWAEEVDMPVRFNFLKCPRCHRPLVTVQENYAFTGGGEPLWEDPVRLFPPRDEPAGVAFPNSIRLPYEEALACFRAKAFAATAIMCRKSLEGMCHEHNARRKGLASGLKELRDKGVIEARLFEWAEALRISGNKAAHDVSPDISRQDAKDILEFTDALLQYVFTFSDRFDRFMERRQKPGSAQGR